MKQLSKAIQNFHKAIFDEGILLDTEKGNYYSKLKYTLYSTTRRNLNRIFMDYHNFFRDPKISVPEFVNGLNKAGKLSELEETCKDSINILDETKEEDMPLICDMLDNLNEAVFDEEILPRDMEEKYYKYLTYSLIKGIQRVSDWYIKYLSKTVDLDHYNAVMPKLKEKLKTEAGYAGYIELTDEEDKYRVATLDELLLTFPSPSI